MLLSCRKRRQVEGDSYTLQDCATLTGLSEGTVPGALEAGLLVGTFRDGRLRVTGASVDRFKSTYIPLSQLANLIGSSTRRTWRICREAGLPVIALRRRGRDDPQPVLRRDAQDRFMALWKMILESQAQGNVDVEQRCEQSLRRYLDRLREKGQRLPLRGRKPNRAVIARACNFRRIAFHRYPSLVKILDDVIMAQRESCAAVWPEALSALREYLERLRIDNKELPRRHGLPNKLAIARCCGINRSFFYYYPQRRWRP
jgi:hypothetical protein